MFTEHDINLHEGEELIKESKPHWSVWWKAIVVGAFLAPFTLGISLVVAFLYVYYLRNDSRYFVTTDRVKSSRYYWFKKLNREMDLKDIKVIDNDSSLVGRILGYGNLRMDSTGLDPVVFNNVKNIEEIKKEIKTHKKNRE